jgi:5-formyltetrahydrofolate cyclo-ligase
VAPDHHKAAWRERLLAARAAVPAEMRAAEAAALAGWVRSLRGTVCAYWPVGTEPGSASSEPGSVNAGPASMRCGAGAPEMLSALVEAGCRVLLPVVPSGGPGRLDWAVFVDVHAMARGRFALAEPAGPRLGVDAIREADTVLVPALAVDRRGVRLGRGGGYYDRSLTFARAETPLVAVVRDEELVAALPAEPHDVRMHAALTPAGGFHDL